MARFHLTRLILLASLAFVLGGCCPYKIDVRAIIFADGSGTTTAVIGWPQMEAVPALCVTALDDAANNALKSGAQVMDWVDLRYIGKRMTYRFANTEELANLLTTSSSLAPLFQHASISLDPENGTVHFSASADYRSSMDTIREARFTLATPGRILSYTYPEALVGKGLNSVTWNLLQMRGQQFEISATASTSLWSIFDTFPGRAGLIILGLIVLGLIALMVKRSRRGSRPQETIGSEAGQRSALLSTEGAHRSRICAKCGIAIPADNRFCGVCGTRLED